MIGKLTSVLDANPTNEDMLSRFEYSVLILIFHIEINKLELVPSSVAFY